MFGSYEMNTTNLTFGNLVALEPALAHLLAESMRHLAKHGDMTATERRDKFHATYLPRLVQLVGDHRDDGKPVLCSREAYNIARDVFADAWGVR